VTDNRAAPHPHTHHLRVQRTARYYTLGGESGAPKSIWFVLHGYAMLAGQFIRFFADLATPETLVVAPEALNRFYLTPVEKTPASERPVGATWMTREDRESEMADYIEYLDALHAELAAVPASFGAKVGVLGFSQGTATATRWVTHSKVQLDRLVLWGGLMPPERDLAHDARLHAIGITYVIGERDHYLSDDMVAAEQARLGKANIRHEMYRFSGGHVISRSVFPKVFGTVNAFSDR
jgi:predicted esterase